MPDMNRPSGVERSGYESVPCNVCGVADADTIYEAQQLDGAARDLVRTFRASGDELLVDRLVRCRSCGLQYAQPAPAGVGHR